MREREKKKEKSILKERKKQTARDKEKETKKYI